MFKKAATNFYPPTVTNNTYVNVKVVNATSPSDFYVIQTDHIQLFDKLKADMNKAYANTTNKIFVPRESMLCAVKAIDNKWYRGVIVAVLPKHQVQVHLVDMGPTIKVATKNTRYLIQDFRIQSKAAMLCMLTDVRPLRVHNYDWPKEAIDYFKSRTEMANRLQMAVIKTGKAGGFSVVLSVIQPTEEICINGLLVRKGWCESIGQESTVVSIPNYDCYETEEAGGGLDVTTVSMLKMGAADVAAAASDRNSKKKKMRMLVRLVNVVSPGDFQAILKKHEPTLQEMDRNIQKAMGGEVKDFSTVDWQPQHYCLAFWREDGARESKWKRGKIVECDADEK
jgi:Tudor domain